MIEVLPDPPSAQSQCSVLLFGDSHSEAVHKAIERRWHQGRPSFVRSFRKHGPTDGPVVGGVSFRTFVQSGSGLTQRDVVVSMLGGRSAGFFGTVQHPQRFDFHDFDVAQPLEANAELIPFRAVEDGVADYVLRGGKAESGDIRPDGARLQQLRSATSARIIHVIPPPPPKDSAYVAAQHEREFERQGLQHLGVSSPELRLKFWWLQTRILQRFCQEKAIEVLMPPDEGITPEGYLRPEYWKGAIHANSDYGEVVISTIEDRCR